MTFGDCGCIKSAAAIIGGLTVVYLSLKVISVILSFVRQFFLPPVDLKKNYGNWAVVTGSTDGIGKAIAKQLAKLKVNLVLVSRSQDKLNAVAQELSSSYQVTVKTEAMDLSSTQPEDYSKLSKLYSDLDVGIVVNNVGLSYEHPEYLHGIDDEKIWKLINLNSIPATMITKTFISKMVERKKGLVVNVSSMSSVLKTPLLSVYGATKAYVNVLTDSLRAEYGEKGVHFQVLCPMFVSTAMTGKRPTAFCPTPDTYAKSAVGTFGKADFTCGYLYHSLQAAVFSLAPTSYLSSYQLGLMKGARARWLKKQEAKKE